MTKVDPSTESAGSISTTRASMFAPAVMTTDAWSDDPLTCPRPAEQPIRLVRPRRVAAGGSAVARR